MIEESKAVASDIETVKQYARWLNEKARIEDELTRVKANLEESEPAVLAYFQHHGLDRVRVEGRTLYLRRELWASRVEDTPLEVALQALHNEGLDEFAPPRINTQRLSAWVREREDLSGQQENPNDLLPDGLRDVIKVTEVYKVGSRRS